MLCWDTEYSTIFYCLGKQMHSHLLLKRSHAIMHMYIASSGQFWAGAACPASPHILRLQQDRLRARFVRLTFCLHSGRDGVPRCALHLPVGAHAGKRAAHLERRAECNE